MLIALAALAPAVATTWYGPVTVSFNILVAGNPFDPEQNDLRVRFIPEKGKTVERLAWVDTDGTVKATLVTEQPGRYRPVLVRNGQELFEPPAEGIVDVRRPLPNGFLRVDPVHKNRFRWDSGEPFWPIGFNMGWQNQGQIALRDQLGKMAASGVTWTRIWSSNWDNKNPWWPNDDPGAIAGELWPRALVTWQRLVDTCDMLGIPFQFVLFNHGSFSSTVNPNWPEHPWNAEKGGFLKNAADFFTDKEAKRRTKMWLRYAIARYGHSPNLMAWELFNEVEWVDARYQNRWSDIAAWHKEMADYIRSLDPYGHLITTSSAMEQTDLWKAMDYYQPHTYPPNVLMAIAGAEVPHDKPLFFGEFGPPNMDSPEVRKHVRDGLYGAMLSNHAGAAQFWEWGVVDKRNVYPEYEVAAAVLKESGLAARPTAKPMPLRVSTPGSADLSFGPGLGWAKAGNTTFELPQDANPSRLGKLPGYLQAKASANRAMFPEPLVFRFNASKPGVFRIRFDQIARAGAEVAVYLNDQKKAGKHWEASSERDRTVSDMLEVPFGAGANVIRIENEGADWARMAGFTLTGLAPEATAMGLGESDWGMLRLTAAEGSSTPSVSLAGLSLADGTYEVTTFDLESGKRTQSDWVVRSSALPAIAMQAPDVVLIFRRKI